MTKTITLCGSMQFAKEMRALKTRLEELGWQVLTPDFTEREKRLTKKEYIFQHFNKIKQSDAILVVNHDKKGIKGYIGSNTIMEIGVAASHNKEIYILNELDSQASEEVKVLATKILNGDLHSLGATP